MQCLFVCNLSGYVTQKESYTRPAISFSSKWLLEEVEKEKEEGGGI